jgi:hypothetical protein
MDGFAYQQRLGLVTQMTLRGSRRDKFSKNLLIK